ncbi:MAG TPA: hypothetical protein VI006_15470 [Solirubrobacteraceae bacterium]
MSEHEERADALEREVEDMEERAERLEDDIDDAREDWKRKKQDPSVPGAPTDGDGDED